MFWPIQQSKRDFVDVHKMLAGIFKHFDAQTLSNGVEELNIHKYKSSLLCGPKVMEDCFALHWSCSNKLSNSTCFFGGHRVWIEFAATPSTHMWPIILKLWNLYHLEWKLTTPPLHTHTHTHSLLLPTLWGLSPPLTNRMKSGFPPRVGSLNLLWICPIIWM